MLRLIINNLDNPYPLKKKQAEMIPVLVGVEKNIKNAVGKQGNPK
jgi:hypothetical protein